LFKSWGFEVLPGKVAGDRADAQRVNLPGAASGSGPLDYIAWLDLHAANLNRQNMITADLSHLTMASAGIIEPLAGAKTRIEPLITTSADSTQIPVAKLSGMPDVAGLLASFKSDDTRYILAARVTGTVATAFPDGPPKPAAPAPAKPGETKPGAAKPAPAADWLKRSVHPINVVVVADTDMLDDGLWVQSQDFFGQRVVVPLADNGDFVADAIDVLAGGEDLIGLRSRGTAARPFEVVDRIRRAAEARYSAEERALQAKLKGAEAKLASLTGKDQTGTAATLSPAQARAIDGFRADVLQTRRQLRDVQAALRSNIAQMKGWLEFVDIALVPIVVAVVAIVLATVRRRRRHRRVVEPMPSR
jgi:ABC-type uncharacterized transport system involved in gliding motility auxiliary subunit